MLRDDSEWMSKRVKEGMWGSLRRKTGHIFCLELAECSKSLNGEEIQKKNSVMARKRQL